MNSLHVESMPLARLRPSPRNARTHSRKQVRQIANAIQRFGFTNPVLISDDDEIIAGHGRVEGAKLLGWTDVPTIRLSHLGAAERRAYMLADNKIALNAGWDQEILAIELQGLVDLEFDVELTGFSLAEVDIVLDDADVSSPEPKPKGDQPEDALPPLREAPVARPGDLWHLGRHRLLCGDARDRAALDCLIGRDRADLVFTDPPYNVPIGGHVCGSGGSSIASSPRGSAR